MPALAEEVRRFAAAADGGDDAAIDARRGAVLAQLWRVHRALAREPAPDAAGAALRALARYAARLAELESAQRARGRGDHADALAAERAALRRIGAALGGDAAPEPARIDPRDIERALFDQPAAGPTDARVFLTVRAVRISYLMQKMCWTAALFCGLLSLVLAYAAVGLLCFLAVLAVLLGTAGPLKPI